VVDVRLDGRDVRVVVTATATSDEGRDEPPPPPPPSDGENISRMTLRLFEQLKNQAEQAAAAQGVSLNTFVSQAVRGALYRKGSHDHGKRGHGPWGDWSGWTDRPTPGKPDDEDDGSSRVHGWTKG
jgi:hypothetical protein